MEDAAGNRTARILIWVIGFFAFINVYSMQSVLPLLMRDFQASAVMAGGTVGATVLAIALVSPSIGMLSDAIGRKSMICCSLLALTVPTALIYFADTIHAVVALRFVQGLAIPGITVVLMAYIGEEFHGRSITRVMSAYVSGTVLGGFAGRFITGHLGDWLGWRSAFAILAALNLVGALAAFLLLPPSRNFRASRDVRGALATFSRHLHNPRLLAACSVGFCVLFSLVGCFTYVNVLLAGQPFGLSSGGLANVFAVYLLGVVVTPMGSRVIHRVGFKRSLLGALVLSAAGVLVTLIPALWCVVAGLALASSGIFLAQAAAISFIADNVSEGRSLASGLYNMCYYAGGAAGAWLCGWAYVYGGWPSTVLTVLIAQMLAMAIAWLTWRPSARVA